MNLNNIFDFIKAFVTWRNQREPANFTLLSEHQYKDGSLLKVSRESVTNRPNKNQTLTLVWVPKNKNRPFFYIFVDSLEGRGIRHLSHRIQILSSDRQLTDGSVKTDIYLSESYYLGTSIQTNAITTKLMLYCHDRNYDAIDWAWEINGCRKQVLGYGYTDFSQERAREDYRFTLDRIEMRSPAPSTINPILLDKINIFLEPKPDPPKSRIIEILLLGGVLIGITWVLFR